MRRQTGCMPSYSIVVDSRAASTGYISLARAGVGIRIKMLPRLLTARIGTEREWWSVQSKRWVLEHAPGDARELVGERDRQDVVVQPLRRRRDPGLEAMALPSSGPEQHDAGSLDEQRAQVTITSSGWLAIAVVRYPEAYPKKVAANFSAA